VFLAFLHGAKVAPGQPEYPVKYRFWRRIFAMRFRIGGVAGWC
jgi:cytochrome bd-type quinol oxidase subunit 1